MFERSVGPVPGGAVAVVGALLLVVVSIPCAAQELQRAKAKFLEGIELVEFERYEEALAAFETSYQIHPKESVLFNIGMCQKALFRWGRAIATFEKFLALAPDASVAIRQDVQLALDEMKQLVGAVTLEDAPPGALVFVDGDQVAATPLERPLYLEPGTHTVSVGLSEKETPLMIRSVAVVRGEQRVVRFSEEEPLPVEAVAQTQRSDEGRPALFKAGWGFVGAGAALVMGGAIPGAMALNLNGDLESECDAGGCPPEQHDELDRRDRLAATSSALMISGAAVAATGVVLLIVNSVRQPEERSSVALTSAVGPAFTGLVLKGRF